MRYDHSAARQEKTWHSNLEGFKFPKICSLNFLKMFRIADFSKIGKPLYGTDYFFPIDF